jgi:hypothetical protein
MQRQIHEQIQQPLDQQQVSLDTLISLKEQYPHAYRMAINLILSRNEWVR